MVSENILHVLQQVHRGFFNRPVTDRRQMDRRRSINQVQGQETRERARRQDTRRIVQRFVVEFDGSIVGHRGLVHTSIRTVNLGQDGLVFVTSVPLVLQTWVQVELRLPTSQPVSPLLSRVSWCLVGRGTGKAHPEFLCGVQFASPATIGQGLTLLPTVHSGFPKAGSTYGDFKSFDRLRAVTTLPLNQRKGKRRKRDRRMMNQWQKGQRDFRSSVSRRQFDRRGLAIAFRVGRTPKQVFATFHHFDRLESVVPQLSRVQQKELGPSRALIRWELDVGGVLIIWRNEAIYDERNYAVRLALMDGDLDRFDGTLRATATQEGTLVLGEFFVDLGFPSFETFLGHILKERVIELIEPVFMAMKIVMEQGEKC